MNEGVWEMMDFCKHFISQPGHEEASSSDTFF